VAGELRILNKSAVHCMSFSVTVFKESCCCSHTLALCLWCNESDAFTWFCCKIRSLQ